MKTQSLDYNKLYSIYLQSFSYMRNGNLSSVCDESMEENIAYALGVLHASDPSGFDLEFRATNPAPLKTFVQFKTLYDSFIKQQ